MFAEQVGGGLHELHGHQFESLLFKPGNDLTGQTSMDCIWLQHQEGSFAVGGIFAS